MKPIIVGQNNPYSSDPEHALAPFPERSAGHRLWRMLRECADNNPVGHAAFRAAHNRVDYMDAFERYNLFDCVMPKSSHDRALLARDFIGQHTPEGSHVILLGYVVLRSIGDAMGGAGVLEPIFAIPQVVNGVTWRWLPHPSGRSIAYNDPVLRQLAGMVLADVLTHCSKEH